MADRRSSIGLPVLAGCAAVLAQSGAEPLPVAAAGTVQVTGEATVDTGQFLGTLVRNFFNQNNNRAVFEFDLRGIGAEPVRQASLVADVLFRQSLFGDEHNWEYLLYPGDGVISFEGDWEPADAVLVGTQVSDGAGHVIELNLTDRLRALVDAGASFAGFQVRTTGPGRALSEVENMVLDVIFGGECGVDLNADGALDLFDIIEFFGLFGSADRLVDFNNDGLFDLFDIIGFFGEFSEGC